MRRFIVILAVMAIVLWGGVASAGMTNFLTYTAEGAGVSIDAKGLPDNVDGQIRADIPVGAEIYKAYLYSASVGYSGSPLVDVIFNGNTLTSNASSRLDVGPKEGNTWVSENRWDVTSIVKGVVGNGNGMYNFGLKETGYLDGEILAVVYKIPTKPVGTTFIFDGELATGGDTFAIGLTTPVNKADPNFQASLSLGISYSYQNAGTQQYSIVDANGQRLTTSAGGEDDGFSSNGGLITAGGIGDTLSNPLPYGLTTGPRYDDELYSLIPFVNNGDTSISFRTNNPSGDDNVFFSSFTTLGVASVQQGVPEPASMLLLGLGLVGLAGMRKKFKS